MRLHSCLAISLLLLIGVAAMPAHGEQVKYYVWTDENGQRHFEDRPPKGRDYETRIIELNDNVMPAPDTGRGEYGDSPSRAGGDDQQRPATRSVEPTEDIKDAAIAEEDQDQQDSGGNSGGADTAPGAEGANTGSTAAGSGAAASGAPASGAATAPGATLVPPPPPPVFGP